MKPLTDKDVGFLYKMLAITVTIGEGDHDTSTLFCKVSLELLAALKWVTESQNCIIDHCLFCRVVFFLIKQYCAFAIFT